MKTEFKTYGKQNKLVGQWDSITKLIHTVGLYTGNF